jgi:hypothetical protein
MGLSETCPIKSSLEGSSMQNSEKVINFFFFVNGSSSSPSFHDLASFLPPRKQQE